MGTTWNTISTAGNLKIGFCWEIELFRMTYNNIQFVGIPWLWSQMLSSRSPLGPLLGPKYRFICGYLKPHLHLGPYVSTYRLWSIGAHPLGPNFWWVLPAALSGLQAIRLLDFVSKIGLFRMIWNTIKFVAIPGLWRQIVSFWAHLGRLVGPICWFPFGFL